MSFKNDRRQPPRMFRQLVSSRFFKPRLRSRVWRIFQGRLIKCCKATQLNSFSSNTAKVEKKKKHFPQSQMILWNICQRGGESDCNWNKLIPCRTQDKYPHNESFVAFRDSKRNSETFNRIIQKLPCLAGRQKDSREAPRPDACQILTLQSLPQ